MILINIKRKVQKVQSLLTDEIYSYYKVQYLIFTFTLISLINYTKIHIKKIKKISYIKIM